MVLRWHMTESLPRSSFAFIFIVNSVIINISFNDTNAWSMWSKNITTFKMDNFQQQRDRIPSLSSSWLAWKISCPYETFKPRPPTKLPHSLPCQLHFVKCARWSSRRRRRRLLSAQSLNKPSSLDEEAHVPPLSTKRSAGGAERGSTLNWRSKRGDQGDVTPSHPLQCLISFSHTHMRTHTHSDIHMQTHTHTHNTLSQTKGHTTHCHVHSWGFFWVWK